MLGKDFVSQPRLSGKRFGRSRNTTDEDVIDFLDELFSETDMHKKLISNSLDYFENIVQQKVKLEIQSNNFDFLALGVFDVLDNVLLELKLKNSIYENQIKDIFFRKLINNPFNYFYINFKKSLLESCCRVNMKKYIMNNEKYIEMTRITLERVELQMGSAIWHTLPPVQLLRETILENCEEVVRKKTLEEVLELEDENFNDKIIVKIYDDKIYNEVHEIYNDLQKEIDC